MAYTRREFVGYLLALAGSQCIPRIVFASPKDFAFVAEDIDAFRKLSSIISGVDQLDEETAQQILNCIRAEPWGKEHLAQIAEKILPPAKSRMPINRRKLLDHKQFTEGERWFIGHLLTTWFTGVYYHQTGNQVVAYRNALMFQSIKEIRPIPGHCDAHFGFWSQPPTGASK